MQTQEDFRHTSFYPAAAVRAITEEKDEYAELVLDYVRIYQRSDIDSLLLTRDDPGGIPNYDGRKMRHVVGGKEVS